MFQIVNPDKRLVSFQLPRLPYHYDFDPNRIFTRTGLEKNVRLLNRRTHRNRVPLVIAAVEDFADQLLTLLTQPRVPGEGIIAVHNNGTSPRSRFSFETFLDVNGYFQGVERMHHHRGRTPFNLFVVTDIADYEELERRDLNVVLENSEFAADDGSLSIFCGKQKIRYANVEARLGDVEKQIEMLDTLREIWNSRPPA